jgi:monoamine oxidase
VTDSESAEDNATYGIAFGYSEAVRDLEDHDEIVSSIQDNVFPSSGVGERSIDAYVAHDWVADRFARGTWVSHGPGFRSKYLEELRAPHGCIHFASADWADGWGGFVDGAIEQGARVARRVIETANADVAQEGAASDG